MLEVTKTIQIRGTSKIGTATAKFFEATISTVSPESMTFNHYIADYTLYKANRSAVSAGQTAFEDAAYALQDELTVESEADHA